MKKIFILLLGLICTISVSATSDETMELTCSNGFTFNYFDPTDDVPSGSWYIGIVDDSKKYVIRLDYLSSLDGKYGTFTIDDMDSSFSYLTYYNYTDSLFYYYKYLEGTTFTVANENGHDVVTGSLVCPDSISEDNIVISTKTYSFHAEYIPQTFEIEGIDLTEASFNEENSDWYIKFNDNDYKVTLDLKSADGSFNGTYTENDAVDNGCYVKTYHSTNTEYFKNFSVTLKLAEGQTNPMKGCEITGTATGLNGDTYNFHMFKDAPFIPKDTIDVNVEVKTAEWPTYRDNCVCYFRLKESGSEVEWQIAPKVLTGNLTEDDLTGYLTTRITENWDFIEVDHGRVNITIDPETMILNVAACLVMKDTVCYRFTFSHQLESKGKVAYNFTNLFLEDSYMDWLGTQWLEASNDDVEFQLYTSDEIPGTYNDKNSYARLYFLDEHGSQYSVESLTILEAASSLDNENHLALHCKFISEDMTLYTVDACEQGTGIRNVNAANSNSTRKILENNKIIIKNADRRFNILGQSLNR